MGFFSTFFGRRSADANEPGNVASPNAANKMSEPPADPPELAPAIAALQASQLDRAIDLATPYLDSNIPAIQADANRICALSYSHLDRYERAFPLWHRLFCLEESAHNALQLATSSVMCGELERGQAWFIKAHALNETSHETSPVSLRTNFIDALRLRGHFAEAFEHLQWLKALYEHLHITDSTFLYMRGVPFFSTFLEKSLPIAQQVLTGEALGAWYISIQAHLDDEGKEAINDLLQGAALGGPAQHPLPG